MANGFVLTEDHAGRLDFDVHSAWSPGMRKKFLASGADGLVANYARGFVGHDLEFVRDLPLRRLDVLARTVTDLSPIYGLADTLQELRVQAGSKTRIDLSALPNLRLLACDWGQVNDTIGHAATTGIENLYLSSYREHDLTPIAHLTALRSLRMKERPALRSLDGVESMPKLEQLGIYLAPLQDTSALARMSSPLLADLALASCRRIESLTDLSGLVGLRELEVSESGTIESLRPISDLKLLHRLYLYGSTKVADGDLTPLLGLTRMRDLRMMNRRNYSPTTTEVKAALGLEP